MCYRTHPAGPATTVMPTPPRWLRENCVAKPTPLALRRRSCQISACSKALAELRTKDVGESENTYVANKSPTCCQHPPAGLAKTVLPTLPRRPCENCAANPTRVTLRSPAKTVLRSPPRWPCENCAANPTRLTLRKPCCQQPHSPTIPAHASRFYSITLVVALASHV